MNIDRIKISQEINFNGLPTWIGLEATLLEGDDEKDGLRQLQKIITDYHQEESKAYTQSKWKMKPDSEYGGTDTGQPKLSKEEELIQTINNCTSFEGDNGLNSYRLPASLHPSTKAAYDLRAAILKK